MQQLSPTLLSWAPDLETQASEQAERTSRLPFVVGHVALMPDAHWGMGSTVGSVIPTTGAIMPAAVGVDIGCVDGETEYFSAAGWRRMDAYDGHHVAQYLPETGEAEFVKPDRYIVREQEKFLHFKTKYGVDQMLTPDHRVLSWKITGRGRQRVMQVTSAAEFAADHERLTLGNKSEFETAFRLTGGGMDIGEEFLRVQVMFMADGHLDHRNGKGIVKLRKQRKIDRARKLLANAGIEFTEHEQGNGDVVFRFDPPVRSKSYGIFNWPALWEAEIVAEECLLWDGNSDDRVFFTRDEASADFVQYCFAAVGYRAVKRADDCDGVIDYRVFAIERSRVSMVGKSEITEVDSTDGKAYCFTVPSGFLVLRRNGNIFMSGNCGMIAADTGLSSRALPDNLDQLFGLLDDRIPAGVGHGRLGKRVDGHRDRVIDMGEALTAAPSYIFMDQKLRQSARAQMGSLGGGNHFVEVCLDETDEVWLVLHSGSRGVGNKLATHHIDIAKGIMKDYFISLEDPDLAYLVEGTPQFESYIQDLHWAQEYAFENRQVMMNQALISLAEVVGAEQITPVETVNCHHNYTTKERHFGRDVWVTRKGAISARAGERGVIPGSMGTQSYIVRGLGNPASMMSSSHGAGRRMSRGQARRELRAPGLHQMMAGKTWNADKAEALLDEDPRAYKDIDVVMRNQADLTEIVHTLHSVLNFKGTN